MLSSRSRILFTERHDVGGLEQTLEPLADVLAGELELLTGVRPRVVRVDDDQQARSGDILLAFTPGSQAVAEETKQDQSYELIVDPDGIVVTSPSYKGVVFGTATLLQSLRVEDERFVFPAMTVRDAPHADYRGLMIDVARQPHSIATLREAVRMARLYKIRYLHLHLTDDQHFTFPFKPVTDNLENNFVYSRQELLDLVAYADARGVTLIPEMDLPGHSSRLRQSGYLGPAKSDYDVADPANYERVTAIIDEMLLVFASSPYFHIGGDESGAGRRLVPFLAAVNAHVRSKPEGEKRRLMVWEGFHGAPKDQLPATGPDRVIVHAWESSYNAPWDLLDNGYTLINSSWKPLYVVGNGSIWHPGRGVRMWDAKTLYRWDKDTLMHWEPGRAVYEDADPNPDGDSDRNDRQWSAAENGQQDQMLGGQLIFWEQREDTVVNDMRQRLPAVAERLWNPDPDRPFEDYARRAAAAERVVMPIVRPVEILPADANPDSPMSVAYRSYTGEELRITLRNRTQIPGQIRYTIAGFSDALTWFGSELAKPVTVESTRYEGQFTMKGQFAIRAQLFREDGSAVEGNDWQVYNNWPDRVRVTEYDIGSRALDQVPDFATFEQDRVVRNYRMPMLRGPMTHTALIGQQFTGTLVSPGTGAFTFEAKTRNGHANVYLDLDQDGRWDQDELFVTKTPRSEERVTFTLHLTEGKRYPVRVDHATAMPGQVVMVTIAGPGIQREREDISAYLEPIGQEQNN